MVKSNASQASKTLEHSSFLSHRKFLYLKLSLLLCGISLFGYVRTDFEPVRNGGTWYGYTLGTLAALLILWLTLLGLRKRRISEGNWSLKAWTSAHVYLGLCLIVVATLHTGFSFGLNIHTLAYALMMVVVISGLFGMYFYAVIPRRMSDNRRAMSQVQMLDEVATLTKLLQETAQPLDDKYTVHIRKAVKTVRLGGGLIRRSRAKDPWCPTQKALNFFREELSTASDDMRTPILDVITVLERKNSLLDRIRKHVRYRTALEIWLYVHIPFTFALLAALIAHIVSVFFYN